MDLWQLLSTNAKHPVLVPKAAAGKHSVDWRPRYKQSLATNAHCKHVVVAGVAHGSGPLILCLALVPTQVHCAESYVLQVTNPVYPFTSFASLSLDVKVLG